MEMSPTLKWAELINIKTFEEELLGLYSPKWWRHSIQYMLYSEKIGSPSRHFNKRHSYRFYLWDHL